MTDLMNKVNSVNTACGRAVPRAAVNNRPVILMICPDNNEPIDTIIFPGTQSGFATLQNRNNRSLVIRYYLVAYSSIQFHFWGRVCLHVWFH
jgi:hypothetical protein